MNQLLTCPKCQGTMRTHNRSGVQIEQCDMCRGIFLDFGELEALSRLAMGPPQHAMPPGAQPAIPQPHMAPPGWGHQPQYWGKKKKGYGYGHALFYSS